MRRFLLILLFLSCSNSFSVKTPLDKSFFLNEIVFTVENEGQNKEDFSIWINGEQKHFLFKSDFQNIYLTTPGPFSNRIEAKICFKSFCRARKLKKAADLPKIAKDVIKKFNKSKSSYEHNWTDAIFLYALAKSRNTLQLGSSELGKAFSFLKKQNNADVAVTTPDLAPTGLSALLLQENSSSFNKIIQSSYKFLKSEPRNELGALNHVGKKHKFASWLPRTDFFIKDSIWLDSLVMYTVPARFYGEKFKDDALIEFAGKQHEIFQAKLRASNGLYKHAFFLKEKTVSPEGEYFWLRGNAWVALSLIELLSLEKKGDRRNFYQNSLQELFKALLPFQKENGLFDTLLTRHQISNYEDISGNCIIAYSMLKAINENIIGEQFRDKAEKLVNGIFHNVAKEGKGISVYNISEPTNAFSYYWYYTRLVGREKNLGYGTGPFILLLSELKGH